MKLFVILLLVTAVSAMQTRSMYMKQLGLSDLKTSASGFVYHGTSGVPISYIQFNPTISKPVQTSNYRFIKPQPILLANRATKENIEILDDEIENDKEEKQQQYEIGNGEDNNSGYHSQKGEKSVTDYNKKHAFDRGEKGSFGNENHKNHYLQNGGNKNGYFNSANGYASQHDVGKASQGGNFEVSGYHKKGQKTTGYHKVYHKDEYKKDHTFYDESDKKGHFSKYGNSENKHQAEQGGHKAGGNSDSGYQNNLYGKQGFSEQGRNDEASKGYDNVSGRESYEADQANSAKNSDSGNNRQYGYSVKQR